MSLGYGHPVLVHGCPCGWQKSQTCRQVSVPPAVGARGTQAVLSKLSWALWPGCTSGDRKLVMPELSSTAATSPRDREHEAQ